MRHARNTWVFAPLLSVSLVFGQAPAKRLLKIEDMHRFDNVGDPRISPDGKWVGLYSQQRGWAG